MKKFQNVITVFAVVAATMATATFFTACEEETPSNGVQNPNVYTLTFYVDGAQYHSISSENGKEINLPQNPTKEGYTFVGWYLTEDGTGDQVALPPVMPALNFNYYAKFTQNQTQEGEFTLNYDVNLIGVDYSGNLDSVYADEGEQITVANGVDYNVQGAMFLGWTDDEEKTLSFSGGAQAGQYLAGDFLVMPDRSITLYAQWAIALENLVQTEYGTVYIYEGLIGRGLGASILVREGKENKLGFAEIDDNNVLHFTFYFNDAEGGDLVGKLNADGKAVFKDDAQGNYLFKNYVDDSVHSVILATDGYGFATISSMVGSQLRTDGYGTYAYQAEYGDYAFTYVDPTTGKPVQDGEGYRQFYFTVQKQSIAEGDGFTGYFYQQGFESGQYLMYDNGELSSYRLDLNGYGGAKLYYNDSITQQTSLEAEGVYAGTDEYQNYMGEWVFLPNDGESFRFTLNMVSDMSGDIPVYIEYNAEYNREFTQEDGNATLYLDGYGSARYVAGGEVYEGICTVGETLLTFIPYLVDANGNVTAGGKMFFNLDFFNGTFTVNTDGYVVEGSVLTYYSGVASIIVIPEGITEISDDVFNYTKIETSITSVTIASTVEKIGARAFQNNYTLTRATFLSQTPIEIDFSAANNPFRWPAGNFVIVVPEGSQEAYKSAWADCPYPIKGSVEVTILPEFEIENNVLLRYNKPNDEGESVEITIPDGVTEIAQNVFLGLDYITSVNLNGVTVIGEGAFENCINLKEVTFTNVQTVGASAFAFCLNLGGKDGKIDLPSIQTVGVNAFQGCEKIKLVKMGEGLQEIGENAFMECHIYADEGPLYIELSGTTPPTMGADIGMGNIAMRIQVPDIAYAVRCYGAATWNKYCKNLYVPSGAEAGTYMDGTKTLVLEGRAVLENSVVWLYEIVGENITFYEYDEEIATYEKFNGKIMEGTIKFAYLNFPYSFTKVEDGKSITYTSADGKYTLVCEPQMLLPEYYDGLGGSATVQLNGKAATLTVKGYNSISIKNYTDTDGKAYDFTLTFGQNNTFTYEKLSATRVLYNLTATDGSVLNLHFTPYNIYVYGQINIEVDGVVMGSFSDYGTVAEQLSANEFRFTRNYKGKNYVVTITVSADQTTFTYEYVIE